MVGVRHARCCSGDNGHRAGLTACSMGNRIDLFCSYARRHSFARLIKHSRCHSAGCSKTGEISFSVRWAELAFHTKVWWCELQLGRDRDRGREWCRPQVAATPLQPRSLSVGCCWVARLELGVLARDTHRIRVDPFRRMWWRAAHRRRSRGSERPPRHRCRCSSSCTRTRTRTRPPQALPKPDHPGPQPSD